MILKLATGDTPTESLSRFRASIVLSERPQEPLPKRTIPRRDLSDPTLNLPARHPLERSAASRLTSFAFRSLSRIEQIHSSNVFAERDIVLPLLQKLFASGRFDDAVNHRTG